MDSACVADCFCEYTAPNLFRFQSQQTWFPGWLWRLASAVDDWLLLSLGRLEAPSVFLAYKPCALQHVPTPFTTILLESSFSYYKILFNDTLLDPWAALESRHPELLMLPHNSLIAWHTCTAFTITGNVSDKKYGLVTMLLQETPLGRPLFPVVRLGGIVCSITPTGPLPSYPLLQQHLNPSWDCLIAFTAKLPYWASEIFSSYGGLVSSLNRRVAGSACLISRFLVWLGSSGLSLAER